MIQLRPYQQRAFDKLLARPDKRLVLAHEMSAGKSYIELAWLQHLRPERALFIVPAVVRPMWAELIATHCPEFELGVIRRGRKTAPLSKAEGAARKAAYESPWQLVSYDLIGEVAAEGWNHILCDEAHNLRNPRSKQSKQVRLLFNKNPEASGALLTGTLIPNVISQIWNPVDTLFPGWCGDLTKTNGEAWRFLEAYCEKEVTKYGTRYFGCKPGSHEKLKKALEPYTDRVVQADFAKYMPPLFVESLRSESKTEELAVKWADNLAAEIGQLGVFCYYHKTADALAKVLSNYNVVKITGESTPEQRAELLARARDQGSCVVVGTIDSLSTGISMSFLKAALVVEWTSAVDSILQFIGRFARQDSLTVAPTRVEFVVRENDDSRMEIVRKRIEAMNAIFKAGRSELLAADVFKAHDMTDERFDELLTSMVAGIEKRAVYAGLQEEEDDDAE